jgi:DNA-binding MurR/RpiR family transcriptional regulator
MRYKEIKSKIQKHYEALPVNQKTIADYCIDNFDKIPFLSVQDISEATSRSVASIVRFAQRVGFKGFQELKDEITKALQNQIKNQEMFSLFDNKKIKADTLTSVASLDTQNINDTLNLIDRKNFDEAIKLILNADRVFTAGLGVSFLLAQILAYQLNQVAVDAKDFTHNQAFFMEQILYLTPKDLIIAFSFPPYSQETIDAVKFAKERGISSIAITNKNAAPISHFSKIVLPVKSENMLFTNSFAAISVLINALATECALKNESKAKKMLKELNKVIQKQNNINK